MATVDRRGAMLSAADPPIGTNPNPDLAIKAPVRVATTGSNITLSGLQTIDALALNVGDRVLVKDQTDATTNGLYNVATGPWTRTIDANNNSQLTTGTQVAVTQGAINSGAVFRLTAANPIVLGTSALTWASGLNVVPLAASTSQGLTITQNAAGTTSSQLALNSISIQDSATVTGLNFSVGLNIVHSFGGSSMQGGREAFQATANLNQTSSASNANRNYVGVVGVGQSAVNDNGTGVTTGTALGAMFGGNFVGALFAGATNFLNVTGAEFNSFVQAGASVALKSLIQVSADPRDRVQGSVVDAMIWAYNQSASSPGWNNGILFDNTGGIGAWPIAAGGTIIKTGGNGVAANGIDFTNTVFSNFAFASKGFAVGPTGTIGSGGAGIANGSITLAGATSGSSTLSANATATNWSLNGASLGVVNTAAGGTIGLAVTTVQSTPHASDNADTALNANYTLAASSATNELVARAVWFNATNNLTGGGAISNLRAVDIGTFTNSGTTTAELDSIYLEAGSTAGTVTTGFGLHIVTLQGSTKWGVGDDSGSNWYNAAGGLSLGNATAAGNGNMIVGGALAVGTTSLPAAGQIYVNNATFMLRTKTSFTNGAGSSSATLTNAPVAGNPTKWIAIDDNGTTRQIPAW